MDVFALGSNRFETLTNHSELSLKFISCQCKHINWTGYFLAPMQCRIYPFVLGVVCHCVKYFSDIDSGWTVARINDNGENTFLEIIFKTFTNQETFYIGGNTDTARGEFLDEGFGLDSGRVLGKVTFTVHDMKHDSQVYCINCPF